MGSLTAILQILDFLLTAVPSAALQIGALKQQLNAFKAEGRDPTPEEWQALFANVDAARAQLDAAADRFRASPTA